MGTHDGHRERKRRQFREHGIDAFADHEVLELLLYYACPLYTSDAADDIQAMHPVARRLINREKYCDYRYLLYQ